jgi:hypothetical protein
MFHSLRDRSLYVTPIRLGLAVALCVAARLDGAPSTSVWLALAGGAFVTAFFLFNDPRAAFLRDRDPQPLPTDATFASPLRQALAATVPSTLGVVVLATIALFWKPELTAVLAGIAAGLGIAGLLYAFRTDPGLAYDARTKIVYRR